MSTQQEREVCQQIVENVFQVLIDGSKQGYIGENISQLAHSLQAAAQAQKASKHVFQNLQQFVVKTHVC
jgi:predicted HD phosphohydrolase